MAQTPAKTKDHPDAKALATQREAQIKSNEEAMKRMETTQPTPTQEENDLAAIGIHVENKQDTGAGPTIIRTAAKSLVARDMRSPVRCDW